MLPHTAAVQLARVSDTDTATATVTPTPACLPPILLLLLPKLGRPNSSRPNLSMTNTAFARSRTQVVPSTRSCSTSQYGMPLRSKDLLKVRLWRNHRALNLTSHSTNTELKLTPTVLKSVMSGYQLKASSSPRVSRITTTARTHGNRTFLSRTSEADTNNSLDVPSW